MKKRIISLVLLGASVLTVTACAALQAQSQCMAEKIIRLHVVANSDSDADQAVKLRVRDAVLREAQNVLSDASDAKQAIAAQLPALEAAANAELRRQGSGDTACVSFRRELFPTRDYDTFSLPSGVYQSLRVTIGEGAGHNWWCVIFPSLCVPATTDGFADAAAAGRRDRPHDPRKRCVHGQVPFSGAAAGAEKIPVWGISAIKSAAGRDAAEPAIWQSCLRMNKYKKSGAVSKEHFETKI